MHALACTWSTGNIYLAGEERLINIRDCVKELVGQFIKAYLSVNPKRQEACEAIASSNMYEIEVLSEVLPRQIL
jgi:hypothetical protein